MTRVVKLVVVSDFICPFCYIGHYELQEAISRCKSLPLEFDVEYRPFRLLPGDEPPPMDKISFMKSKLGPQKFDGVMQVISKWQEAQPAGGKLSFSGMMSQSTQAHRMILKAFKAGGQKLQLNVLDIVFKAYSESNLDIGNNEVLAAIAERTGLMSRAEAIRFLESDELKAEVDEMVVESQSKGIKGVPFTVIDGKWAVSGGQSADVYVQIFKKLATCSSASHGAASDAYASCVIEAAA